jgi:lipopolysaccharide transport system ATP-binding protein
MSNAVIKVESLGKKYIIRHQKQEKYNALRDVIDNGVKNLFKYNSQEKSDREEFWALNDVSFEINQGDRVGIVGRNGAGKSTLLKILSRITEPTKGQIKIKGRVASLLEVGTGFHPELTGRENIFLNGAILGMSKVEIQRKFDEIVAFAEIEKFLDTPVKRYSSGMYVRLAFAVAAHLEPEILIVDEVLAVGDAQFQKKCLGKMENVGKEGRTVIFVSHNMATVKQLCTKAFLFSNGILIDRGKPVEMISRYMQSAMSQTYLNGKREYKHIKGDKRAKINKIILNNLDRGEMTLPIFEKIKIAIEYQIIEPIEKLEFFILIYSLEEGDVQASLFQRDSGSYIVPDSEFGIVSLEFTNYLMPGKYIISAGIFDKNKQFVDWVEYAESFSVEPAFNNGKKYDSRLGKVSFYGNWHTEQENQTVNCSS